ncbi:MAG: hypothetical protein ACSLFR_00155 [Solirubrobacteraceae bacterium]
MSAPTTAPSAADIRERLDLLVAERALAAFEGLSNDPLYGADLDDEIIATQSAYIGAAVTEIASLRGQLSGPLQG